ncbi:MAG TPA: hypothetical protein VI997_00065 [Candidatus Thermoplasmatota archaeon]|nr:hypothetical protein [Candidatus Thermoplasmatota archaeon]
MATPRVPRGERTLKAAWALLQAERRRDAHHARPHPTCTLCRDAERLVASRVAELLGTAREEAASETVTEVGHETIARAGDVLHAERVWETHIREVPHERGRCEHPAFREQLDATTAGLLAAARREAEAEVVRRRGRVG